MAAKTKTDPNLITPGEVAYRAFTSALRAHVLLGHEQEERYPKLPAHARAAWEAAAEALLLSGFDQARLEKLQAIKARTGHVEAIACLGWLIDARYDHFARVDRENAKDDASDAKHHAIDPR